MPQSSKLISLVALSALVTSLVACQGVSAPQVSPTPSPLAPAAPLIASVSVAVAKAPAAIAAAGGFVYVGSAETGLIQVLDASGRLIKEIASPGGSVAYLSPFEGGLHLFALDAKAGTARVIDPAKDHAVIQTIALGTSPTYAVLSPDDPTVMVALAGEAKAVLLTFDDADRAKAPVRRDFAVGAAGSGSRTLGYDHGWVVVPNAQDDTVSLFNLTDGQVKTMPGGKGVGDAHMGVWGGVARQAMVVGQSEDAVSLFAIPTGERTTITGIGKGPADFQGEENLRRAYIAMKGSDELAVIDYDKRRLFGKVTTGRSPSTVAIVEALVPAGAWRLLHEEDNNPREVWVGNEGDGTMTVIDGSTLLVKATIRVGAGPHRVTFEGTRAFVANRGDGTVSIVDRTVIK